MAKSLLLALITASFLSLVACSTPSGPPKKKSLSTQPHNRPASWEGTGGLGAVMGPQYSD